MLLAGGARAVRAGVHLTSAALGVHAGLFASDPSQPDIEFKAVWPETNQMGRASYEPDSVAS